MNRRSLLASAAESLAPDSGPGTADLADAPQFANTVLPRVQRTNAGLEPYTGTFGRAEAEHLMRRTLLGFSRTDIATAAGLGLTGMLNQLLATPTTESTRPPIVDARDSVAPVGGTWVDKIDQDPAATVNPSGLRTTSLKAWWFELMLTQPFSVRERMTLFWHDHFSTETGVVGEPRFSYWHFTTLRSNALGNFKDLTRQITVDGAMLRYLNGNTNRKGSPNENYARELQELFTIGKGPEVAAGDYTFYTEADVKAAARVLTGWKDLVNADKTIGPVTSIFVPSNHDATDKQFSARYNNTVITGGSTAADGPREVDALLTMIFAQPETAKHLCRKLYRWFVYYVIDDAAEANVIAPMADLLRTNNYEVLPVLRALLGSAHFFDPVNRGCMIKSPLELVIGTCRHFALPFSADLATRYAAFSTLLNLAAAMGMNLGDPPDVAGWQAYYHSPEFYELWINTDTLPKRSRTVTMLAGSGFTANSVKVVLDPIGFVQTLPDASSPSTIVSTMTELLFAVTLTDGQNAFLKDILLNGLPDYEWGAEWNAYLADPGNKTKLNVVKTKLTTLFTFMVSMPEYHLL